MTFTKTLLTTLPISRKGMHLGAVEFAGTYAHRHADLATESNATAHRHGIGRHGIVQHAMARLSMARHGMTLYGMAIHGTAHHVAPTIPCHT